MTGIRIVNINNVFSFQIQEGVLLPGGGIGIDNIKWKKIEVTSEERLGVDRNKFYLDSIDMEDDNAVLTGIKFEVASNDAVAIALHYSKFDVSADQVKYLGEIGWKSNKDVKERYVTK